LAAIGAIPGDLDNFMQPRLVDGQRVRFPCCNARLAEINNSDFNVGVLFCYDGTRRTALFGMRSAEDSWGRKWLRVRRTYHVAGADAADVGDLAGGFPARHYEVVGRSEMVIWNSITTRSDAEEASTGRSVTKGYLPFLARWVRTTARTVVGATFCRNRAQRAFAFELGLSPAGQLGSSRRSLD